MSDDIELPYGPLHFVSAIEADELRAERDELREALEKIVTVADRCGGYRGAAGMGIMETIARQALGAAGEGSVSDGD